MTKTHFGPFSVEMFDLNICLILGHKFLHDWETSLWTLDTEVSRGKQFYKDLNYKVMLLFRTIYEKRKGNCYAYALSEVEENNCNDTVISLLVCVLCSLNLNQLRSRNKTDNYMHNWYGELLNLAFSKCTSHLSENHM